jgi:hypothetical protein
MVAAPPLLAGIALRHPAISLLWDALTGTIRLPQIKKARFDISPLQG